MTDRLNGYSIWRAALYGVNNVFAQTPLDQVTVTATPLEADSLRNMNQTTLLEDQSVTLEMSREEASDMLSESISIDSLSGAKVVTDYGHRWSGDFNNVYYEDQQPGFDALISGLSQYCNGRCE